MQDERHIHFLIGWNESHAFVRENILIFTPRLFFAIQDEKQRKVYVSHQHPEESSFSVMSQKY